MPQTQSRGGFLPPLLLAKRQGRAAEGKKQHRRTAAGVESQKETVIPEIRKGSLQRGVS